nr:MAG TPA_asm: hypothetical protein [Caudoviricetes sp.]DAW66588.1 MAG TPA: hypothetical protein [Caudoviricetes sp.]
MSRPYWPYYIHAHAALSRMTRRLFLIGKHIDALKLQLLRSVL